MVFVGIGLLVGPEALDAVVRSKYRLDDACLPRPRLRWCCADASRIDLGQLRRAMGVPIRLGVGLPFTIAFGTVAAALVFGQLGLDEALTLGVVLAPTDAALVSRWACTRARRSAPAKATAANSSGTQMPSSSHSRR